MSGEWASYAKNDYQSGRPWAICDRCSFKRRHDTLRHEWTGLLVCTECFDARPPQLTAPNVYPEGLPIQDPRPDFEYNPPVPDFLAVFDAVRDGETPDPEVPEPNHYPLNAFPLEADFLATFRKYRK